MVRHRGGMNERPAIARQLRLELSAGDCLMNHVMRSTESTAAVRTVVPRHTLAKGHARRPQGSVVALGAEQTIAQFRWLLHTRPLEVPSDPYPQRIRVLGAIDYVVDRQQSRVYGTPSDRRVRRGAFGDELTVDAIDLLRPLCKPFLLRYLAFLPTGVCARSTLADRQQGQLWRHDTNALQALPVICARAWAVVRQDPALRRLRRELVYWLVSAIGSQSYDLALRSRNNPGSQSLSSAHLALVWRYWHAYRRMQLENPQLLPVLTAWLRYRRRWSRRVDDEVPAMRRDLLARGFAPGAWRYLARHGARRLMDHRGWTITWPDLVLTLKALAAARWPEPPPRGFIRLLFSTAGVPRSYLGTPGTVPGWFWNWTCAAANACGHDAGAYRKLQDNVVIWAWLVRRCQVRPDANQRRRRLDWLARWADKQEALVRLSGRDAWAGWLRDVDWSVLAPLRVVPLLSPRSLLEEARTMHNCADAHADACEQGKYLLLSLRRGDSGKRVALVGLRHARDGWRLHQVAGPCNHPVSDAVHASARAVAVRVHHAARSARRAAASSVREQVVTYRCRVPK